MRFLKSTIFILFLHNFLIAQTTDVLIENGRMEASQYKFDVFLNRTSSWGTDILSNYLGDASFRFTKNVLAFESSAEVTSIGPLFNNSSYYITTQVFNDQINLEVNYINKGTGSELNQSNKYLLCTISLPVRDQNQLTTIGWVPLSTAIFNGKDQNIYPTLLGGLEDEPVPVELTDFSATKYNASDVLLTWETATEVNNYGFDIERKNRLTDWEKIGFVEGHGNSYSPKHYSFNDNKLIGGSDFRYRLKQLDFDGTYDYSSELVIEVLPLQNKLFQNYPNPFNPKTNIKFSVKETSDISVKVYNTLGEVISSIVSGTFEAGFYEVEFDGKNISSGIYFCEIQINEYYTTNKMILLK